MRSASRWALAGAIAAVVLALVTATALSYADGDRPAGHVADLAPPPVAVLWRVPTGAPVTGPPAVLSDRIVLGGADGTIRAFGLANGNPRWTFYAASGHAVYTRAAANLVYAVTGGGEVFAVDAGTGRQRWRADTKTTFRAQPAIGPDRLYASGDSALHAYRLDDGTHRWQVPAGGRIRTGPALVGSVAVVAGGDGRLYMAGRNGDLRRKPRLGAPAGGPIAAGDAACVPLADGSVRCVRTADGKKLARITLPGTKLSAPIPGDGVIFAAGADGSVGAWDTESGARPWLFRAAKPPAGAAHLVRRADRLIAAYPDGRLIGIDALTGVSEWDVTLPDHFDVAPRLDAKALYVVGRTGTLYALRTPGSAHPATTGPASRPRSPGP